jgi:hypothetical protein
MGTYPRAFTSTAVTPRFAERALKSPPSASRKSENTRTKVDRALIEGDTPNLSELKM